MTVKEFVKSPFGVKFCITHDGDNRGGMLNIFKPQFITVPVAEDAEVEVSQDGRKARLETPAIVINFDILIESTHCVIFQP